MTSCTRFKVWPGNRESTKKIQESIDFSSRGYCFSSGFQHRFSLGWLFTTHEGLINLAIYLWLLKDMAWSQLRWFYIGIIFGTLALLLNIFLIFAGFYYKIYSEALIGIGTLLWLTANYVWMIGEIWGYKITLESPSVFIPDIFKEEDGTDIFYDDMTELAQKISIACCSFLFVVIFVLPFFYYDKNRVKLLHHTPRYHFGFFFRDFIEFENFHLFLWAVKDLCWLFDNYVGYILFLFPTVVLMIDSMYILYTTENQLIDFFHYILLFLWILSNFLWATSELVVEDDNIPDEAWETYVIFDPDIFEYFYFRMFAGFVYLVGFALLAMFYVYWIFVAEINEEYSQVDSKSSTNGEKSTVHHYELTQT